MPNLMKIAGNISTLVLQMLVFGKQPPLTSTHLQYPMDEYIEQPNDNLMYTVDHTFGYCSKEFICTCAKSSVHAHDTEFRG